MQPQPAPFFLAVALLGAAPLAAQETGSAGTPCPADTAPAAAAAPAATDPVDLAFAAALPPSAECRFTLIDWRTSLTDALAEARELRRPVYLYVNDGDPASGRC